MSIKLNINCKTQVKPAHSYVKLDINKFHGKNTLAFNTKITLRKTSAKAAMSPTDVLVTKTAYMSPNLFKDGEELDDLFTGMTDKNGLITIAGYGSLLSERSARSTFPSLTNFRPAKIFGWRRVFSHTCDIFFRRGIANRATGEISSLSVEPWPQHDTKNGSDSFSTNTPSTPSQPSLVISLFEVPSSPEFIAAFLDREQEFKFVAVRPYQLDPKESLEAIGSGEGSDSSLRNPVAPSRFPDPVPGEATGGDCGRWAVLCTRSSDEEYRRKRCTTQAAWDARWGNVGIDRIWFGPEDIVKPCRVYTRHCMLAAQRFCRAAKESFLHQTYLNDRETTLAEYLKLNPEIMEELPPRELAERYGG